MRCSPQLRFHESRLIVTAHGAPTRLRRPTAPREGGPATPKVPQGDVLQPLGCWMGFRTSAFGNRFRCKQGFHNGIKCAAAWPDEVSAKRPIGQPRSSRTTMTMTRRRPTEPPPIQMALARTGENKRYIICLSFLRAIHLPSFSEVTVRDGTNLSNGV